MEIQLLNGLKENLKAVHSSQDGAILLQSIKTRFIFLGEDSVMT